jgi:hypothetical protein
MTDNRLTHKNSDSPSQPITRHIDQLELGARLISVRTLNAKLPNAGVSL